MPIQLQSPIAAARRKERLMREQMAADFQLQAMRGEQDRIEAERRNQQQLQRAAFQHFLGQAQQFGGMDETIARQKNIMGEQRAQAAEAQRVKERPVQLRSVESLTRQKEYMENMLAMKNAIAAGKSPSEASLVGPPLTPDQITRMAAEANRITNEQAQKHLTNLGLAISRQGTKAYQKGKKGTGIGKIVAKHQTIGGVRQTGFTFEYDRPKPSAPTGKKASKVKGALAKPPPGWAVYRPDSNKIANVAALKAKAGGPRTKKINGLHSLMTAAHKVSILRPGKKKDSATALLMKHPFRKFTGDTVTPFNIYHAAQGAKLKILTEIGVEMAGGDAWWGRAKGRVATGKATEKAGAQLQEKRDKAQYKANGHALKGLGLRKDESPVGNKVAKGLMLAKARKLTDKKLGIEKQAQLMLKQRWPEKKYKFALDKYNKLSKVAQARSIHPKEAKEAALQKYRDVARERAGSRWDDTYKDEYNALLLKFEQLQNPKRRYLLKEAGVL